MYSRLLSQPVLALGRTAPGKQFPDFKKHKSIKMGFYAIPSSLTFHKSSGKNLPCDNQGTGPREFYASDLEIYKRVKERERERER